MPKIILTKTEKIDDYISLAEATKFCNYSQEYLSLRARRGKLKSAKIGRNWKTTRKWLDEYIKKTEEYKNDLEKKSRSKEIFFKINNAPIIFDKTEKEATLAKALFFTGKNIKNEEIEKHFPIVNFDEADNCSDSPAPPKNLPIEKIAFKNLNKNSLLVALLKIGFSLGLVFGVLLGALIFNKAFLGDFLNSSYSAILNFSHGMIYANDTFKNYFSWLGDHSASCLSGTDNTCIGGASKFFGLANGLGAVLKYFNF